MLNFNYNVGMQQIKSGTSTKIAVQAATQILSAQTSSNADKIMAKNLVCFSLIYSRLSPVVSFSH